MENNNINSLEHIDDSDEMEQNFLGVLNPEDNMRNQVQEGNVGLANFIRYEMTHLWNSAVAVNVSGAINRAFEQSSEYRDFFGGLGPSRENGPSSTGSRRIPTLSSLSRMAVTAPENSLPPVSVGPNGLAAVRLPQNIWRNTSPAYNRPRLENFNHFVPGGVATHRQPNVAPIVLRPRDPNIFLRPPPPNCLYGPRNPASSNAPPSSYRTPVSNGRNNRALVTLPTVRVPNNPPNGSTQQPASDASGQDDDMDVDMDDESASSTSRKRKCHGNNDTPPDKLPKLD